jgi:multidrug efflux pump subunit AcrA (membrane-fusion protein)
VTGARLGFRQPTVLPEGCSIPDPEISEASMQQLYSKGARRWIVPVAAGVILASAIGVLIYWNSAGASVSEIQKIDRQLSGTPGSEGAPTTRPVSALVVVTLSRDQQDAIALSVVPAALGAATDVIDAPGQIVPDESRFAYITPRAAGIVRTVKARIGQDVQAGFVLAMIDSSEVAKARLNLYTCLQELEIAKTTAQWQKTTYQNTHELVERLRAKALPEKIQREFEDRPLGDNRDKLLTAYAKLRLETENIKSKEDLFKQHVITPKEFREARAEYEIAVATYQGLMDQMEYTNKRARDTAAQALQRVEAEERVAREQLRVLGLPPDGTEPEIKDGRVVGVLPDGSLPVQSRTAAAAAAAKPDPIMGVGDEDEDVSVTPVGAPTGADTAPKNLPVSTYAIWAPFAGTILDREQIVPGVYADTTHRIFTLADLSSVWVEVAIHESQYGALSRSQDAAVVLSSPAYPGRRFGAEVIYTGDTVDPKSRTIKLLARAENRDRALKPGMFVDVTLRLKGALQAILIPDAAILGEDDHKIVFVQTGAERFERRVVVTGASDGSRVAVLKGIEPGENVVVDGAFKLKSKAIQVE